MSTVPIITPLHRWVGLRLLCGDMPATIAGAIGWHQRHIDRCIAELATSNLSYLLLHTVIDELAPFAQREIAEISPTDNPHDMSLRQIGLRYATRFKHRHVPHIEPYTKFGAEQLSPSRLDLALRQATLWGFTREQIATLYGGDSSQALIKYLGRRGFVARELTPLEVALDYIDQNMSSAERAWLRSLNMRASAVRSYKQYLGEDELFSFWLTPEGRHLGIGELAKKFEVSSRTILRLIHSLGSSVGLPGHNILVPAVYYICS